MAVLYDTVTPDLQNASSSQQTTAHTVSAAGSPAIVVFVGYAAPATCTVSGITYAGAALDPIGSIANAAGSANRLEAWGKAGCATGNNNVITTLTEAHTDWDIVVVSFTGVLQDISANVFTGLQTGKTESGTATHIDLTVTCAVGDMPVVGTVSTAQNATTSTTDTTGGSVTQRWLDNSGSSNVRGATGVTTQGTSLKFIETWDVTSTQFSALAFNIVQSSGGTTPITIDNLPIDSLAGGEIV